MHQYKFHSLNKIKFCIKFVFFNGFVIILATTISSYKIKGFGYFLMLRSIFAFVCDDSSPNFDFWCNFIFHIYIFIQMYVHSTWTCHCLGYGLTSLIYGSCICPQCYFQTRLITHRKLLNQLELYCSFLNPFWESCVLNSDYNLVSKPSVITFWISCDRYHRMQQLYHLNTFSKKCKLQGPDHSRSSIRIIFDVRMCTT